MVLFMQQRLSESRSYGPAVEIVWDTSKGASANSLRQCVADTLCIPAHQVALAKHFPQRYDWMIIQEVTKVFTLSLCTLANVGFFCTNIRFLLLYWGAAAGSGNVLEYSVKTQSK